MRRHLISATAATTAATVSFGMLAGSALAQGASPTGHPTKNPPAPAKHRPATAAPKPAGATVSKLYMYDAFFVHKTTVDVPGRALHVTGYVRPFVPHQKVTLVAKLGKKTIATRRLNIHQTKPGSKTGRFVGTVTPPAAGLLHLKVTHDRSPRLQGFHAGRGVEILARDGSSKLFTALVQQKLARLHLYMPMSGVWDLQTELAVDAYHRLLGRGASTMLDASTLNALLDGEGKFAVRDPQDGKHVEGDLGNQLLALIQGSKVERIYPISSGKPSTPTILGRYHVYLRTPGYLPDGMYYSSFFIRGYAIHGYDPAPDYPASHGCMRLPISDAISVYNWLSYGNVVDVYR